jgi:hypothetical protein
MEIKNHKDFVYCHRHKIYHYRRRVCLLCLSERRNDIKIIREAVKTTFNYDRKTAI